MQLIKRFVKGGYLRTAGGVFGTIVHAAGEYVTFFTTSGELRTIHKSGAFKTSRQEVERHKAEAKAEAEVEVEAEVEEKARAEEKAQAEEKGAAPAPATIVADSYRLRYQNVQSVNGNSSKICGDRISKILHGKTIQEVANTVAEYIGVDATELLERYEHLNPGQQRMNMGNRLRHWARTNSPDFLIKD